MVNGLLGWKNHAVSRVVVVSVYVIASAPILIPKTAGSNVQETTLNRSRAHYLLAVYQVILV